MDLYIENNGIVPTLHSEGITLRPLDAADTDAIVSALSQWSVTRWLTVVPFPFEREHALYFINEVASQPDDAHWAIDLGSGLAGVISVKPDLGYWLHPDVQGKGLMTRAAEIAIRHYFSTTDENLVSGFHAGNERSEAVLLKLGFENTHIETALQVCTQKQVEVQRMKLTNERWQATNG